MSGTRTVSPSLIIRRRAVLQGVFGGNRLWRLVAYVVFGRQLFKRLFGKNPELLGVLRMKGPGHVIQVATYRKPTRRQRRKARAAGTSIS